MRTPVDEQETTITWYRDEDTATIYTSDYTMMTKYDKNVSSGDWELLKVDTCEGDVVAKTYSAPKELVYGSKKKRVMSEEGKELRRKLMHEMWGKKDT